MIQVIKYYYDIDVESYTMDNNAYVFNYNNKLFYFVLYQRTKEELSDIIQMSKELKENNIYCHDLIYTRFNEVIVIFKNREYILLKVRNDFYQEISSIDMHNINNRILVSGVKRRKYINNWKELWQSKVSYFESQIRDYGKCREGILNTFSYYVGLAENAIQFISLINNKYFYNVTDKLSFCHRRVFFPNYKLNYLNPLTFVIDLEIRDYAEYFKSAFFGGEDIKKEFVSLLKINKMSDYEYTMFFARLLFPTYYFDIYEKIIYNEVDEDKLIEIVKYRIKYEDFLKFAYDEIKKYTNMPIISWLVK